MMTVLVVFVLLLGFTNRSDAAYCLCSTSASETTLQRNIDYACGAGADCTAIQQNGACYNPNTVRDHCNYAVNSYYQRKAQATGSCDFQGTASVSQNPPNAGSGCVFQSGPSTGGTPTTPNTGGTPTTPNMGGTPTTPVGGGTPTTPTIGGTPANPNTGSTIPGTTTPGFGGGLGPAGPAGSGFGPTDNGATCISKSSAATVLATFVALLASSFM